MKDFSPFYPTPSNQVVTTYGETVHKNFDFRAN